MHRVRDLLTQGTVNAKTSLQADTLFQEADAARKHHDVALRLENVLITCATHPDLQSWQAMQQELKDLFAENGFDLDRDAPLLIGEQIRTHPFSDLFSDVLELYIGTLGHMASLGGPPATQENMQPWAEAMYIADNDPLRTGIRRLLYAGVRPQEDAIDAVVADAGLSQATARTLSWLGTIYQYAGASEKSDRVLRDALDRYPTDVMLNFDYGFTLASQGRHHEAIRMYQRALAFRPDAAGLWQIMGVSMMQVEEFANAADAFRRSTTREPDYIPTYINLAEAQIQLGHAELALANGKRVIEHLPDRPDGYGLAGRALMQLRNYQAALPLLEKCDTLARQTPWNKPSADWLQQCQDALAKTTQDSTPTPADNK